MASHPYWDENEMTNRNESPEILALGDSWFWYPFNNLLNPIFNIWNGNRVIYALGDNGANLRDYLTKSRYRDNFLSSLETYKRKIKLVLLSGGGNDVAGDDFKQLLKGHCAEEPSAAACFVPGQPDAIMNEFGAHYRNLVDAILNRVDKAVLAVHNYDYGFPSGRTIFGFGSWLKKPMDDCVVPAKYRIEIIRMLIDGLGAQLTQLEQNNPEHVVFVRTAGTLKTESEWANELHPTRLGFERIGSCFKQALAAIMKQKFRW